MKIDDGTVDRLERAIVQARPDENGFRAPIVFDVEDEGWTFRVLVQCRQAGLTREQIINRREKGET